MALFTAQCPHCKQQFNAQTEWIGQNTNCPTCGKLFTIRQKQTLPQSATNAPKQQHTVAETPNEGKSKASLILGIIGCIAWLLPIVGIPIGIVGLVLGIRKRYRIGIILNITVLVFAVGNATVGAINGATMSDRDRWIRQQMGR